MAETGNRGAVLGMFAAYGFYLLTLFGLRPLLLKPAETFSAREFQETYPGGKRLHTLHALLSLPALLAFIGMPFLGKVLLEIPSNFGTATWLAVSGWTLFNGLFELATGVCPEYGLLIKRHWKQHYSVGPQVRTLGAIRIAISGVIIGVLWWLART